MPNEAEPILDPSDVAEALAAELNQRGHEYALGGAIALGYWAQPRGTMDVDLTLFLPIQKPSEIVWVLGEVGCELSASQAVRSIQEHGFCKARFLSCHIDVFIPSSPFYDLAKKRRRVVQLGQQRAMIWDAETLSVFKMMFFRRKDLADVEQILQNQGAAFDRAWVRERILEMYGARDARITEWDLLASELTP